MSYVILMLIVTLRTFEDGVGDGPGDTLVTVLAVYLYKCTCKNRKNARSCAAAGPARGAAARGRRPSRGGGAVALGTLASNLSRVGGRAVAPSPSDPRSDRPAVARRTSNPWS